MTVEGDRTGVALIPLPGVDEPVEIAWSVATDVGRRRSVNEDSAIAMPPIFAVADGMGGHTAGDRASRAIVTRFAEAAADAAGVPGEMDLVLAALDRAADDIDAIAEDTLAGVGTTVVGMVLGVAEGRAVLEVLNIGDSRLYRFERNELRQVTVDHSVVQELIDAGMLAEADAEEHPESNVITRSVGFREVPQPDRWTLEVRAGMRMLLCSDGLTREVDAGRIRLHLAAGLSPSATASALVDAALAGGGRDNITVLVVDIVAAPASAPPATSQAASPGAAAPDETTRPTPRRRH